MSLSKLVHVRMPIIADWHAIVGMTKGLIILFITVHGFFSTANGSIILCLKRKHYQKHYSRHSAVTEHYKRLSHMVLRS